MACAPGLCHAARMTTLSILAARPGTLFIIFIVLGVILVGYSIYYLLFRLGKQ